MWKQRPREEGLPKVLTTTKKYMLLVVGSSSSWIVDSGATNHVCNSFWGFRKTKRLIRGEHGIQIGNGAIVWPKAVGYVILRFDSDRIVLKDILHIPGFQQNLISVSVLSNQGYSVSFFHSGVKFSRNGRFIYSGKLYDNLYHLNPSDYQVYNVENKPDRRKRKSSSNNNSYLWHLRLGYINSNRIQRLIQDGSLGSLKLEEWSQ